MHLALCAFGTVGDVLPLLQIAKVIQEQGGHVTCILNPVMSVHAEALELSYVAVGEPWKPESLATDPRLLNPRFVWSEVFRPQIQPMFHAIHELHQAKPLDGVINHIWCFGGSFAAESLGVPSYMVGLAPITWFSLESPPQVDHRRMPPAMHRWAMKWIARPLIQWIYEPGMQAEAKAVGLPFRRHRFWGVQQEAALNLGLWSPHWRPPASDDPPCAHAVGFPLSSSARSLSEQTESFLSSGKPPIVMGLGSALSKAEASLYQLVLKVAILLGERLILVGVDASQLAGVTEDVCCVPFEPYSMLFEQARCIIHHGGIGTTAEAIRAGAPQLVIGFGNDQHANGFRTESNQLGLWLPKQRATPRNVMASLQLLLTNSACSHRAQAMSQAVGSETPGQIKAARLILEHQKK